MKSLITLLLACCSFQSWCRNATFEKLCEVNKCWPDQKDISRNLPAPPHAMTERAWIALHLALVEQALRQRSAAGLTGPQAANRLSCLSYLHEYMLAAKFPVNKRCAFRTPIFIDAQDNFCAVGFLLKRSGYEALSRQISAGSNLAYVKDMAYPGLSAWAEAQGFTIDELAWIQPGYPPTLKAAPVGAGVNGEVMELFADDTSGRLYVGGNFTRADDSIRANSIAWLSEAAGTYTWHAMDSGLNGTVYAIAKYKGRIFAAGNLTVPGRNQKENAAYWNGITWGAAGCLQGTVYELGVMDGTLYAAGSFRLCGGSPTATLARWNDTTSDWELIPGVAGNANTFYALDTTLVLGGALLYNGVPLNVMRWNKKAGFMPFIGGIANEVASFELFNNTLYAGCRRTSTVDSINLLVQLSGNQWQPLSNSQFLMAFNRFHGRQISINTLCTNGGFLTLGGSFFYLPGIGTYGENCVSMNSSLRQGGPWFTVDSPINKLVAFKKELIAGGGFRNGLSLSGPLNGMARIPLNPSASVPGLQPMNTFECFPNPVPEAALITVKNNFAASRYVVTDITGRQMATGNLARQAQLISLPGLAPGTYFLGISNEHGAKAVKPLIIR